ncbi:MAG: PilZ domain-containing protein [Clostridiaceae bacterium]|jgi:hypothetical protein|nr:PilZ domain-containing protein [Clostridiaceae bacterium]
MNSGKQGKLYALLDSRNAVLAQGRLENPPDAPDWQVRVPEDKISAVMEHEEIQLVPIDGDGDALLGRVRRNRNDLIVLQKLQSLGSEMRQNLRMPTHFQSFIYPVSGGWKGRRQAEANDLSCGGVAFFCAQQLEDGEVVELVVPITSEPLILKCQVLRRRPSDRENEVLYAAKFVEMCDDEEMIVREAVFSVQVRSRAR